MIKTKWEKLAKMEYEAMDKGERADWKDLRELVEKRG
jgi:hypothetical protein